MGGILRLSNDLAQWFRVSLDPKALEQTLALNDEMDAETKEKMDDQWESLTEFALAPAKYATVFLSGVVTPYKKTEEGFLIKSATVPLMKMLEEFQDDWDAALKIPPHHWEEIIAAAYEESGFDKVTLTPRSGDHGRDVIAIKEGFGSIKIVGSVKAYGPKHLVTYDDVRSLIGVVSSDHDASKGVLLTTSDFPPLIMKDPFIASHLPTRLELVNGVELKKWLMGILKNGPKATLH